MILGEPPAYSGVFSPRRFSLKASKQNLKEDIRVSVKSLSRQFFTGPKKSVDDLLPGQAGIVRLGGRKVAAYRDESDRLYHISAKCCLLYTSLPLIICSAISISSLCTATLATWADASIASTITGLPLPVW